LAGLIPARSYSGLDYIPKSGTVGDSRLDV
jgi:hypothetical protein